MVTAQRVDDRLEALEVDLHEVLDVEPVEVADDRLQAVVAARHVGAGKRSARLRTEVNQALIFFV